MRINNWRALLLTSLFVATASLAQSMTDKEVRQQMIRESIQRYSGSCPCPYSRASNGSRCGGRSAYSRPGGAAPLYYERDITDAMVRKYRERKEIS